MKKEIVIVRMVKMLFILLLMLVIFPNRANAVSDNLYISCDESTLKPGETAKCYIKMKNYSGQILTFHGVLSLSDSIPVKSITKDSGWEGDTSDNQIDLYNDLTKTGNINFVSFEFKVPSSVDSVTVTLSDLILSDENYEDITANLVNNALLEKTFYINGSSGNEEPGNEEPGVVDPGNNEQPNTEPTTTKTVTTQPSTTKQNSSQSTNVDNNPKTGLNSIVAIILAVTSLTLILLVKKGVSSE